MKKKMKYRIISFVLVLAMIIPLLTGFIVTVSANSILPIETSWYTIDESGHFKYKDPITVGYAVLPSHRSYVKSIDFNHVTRLAMPGAIPTEFLAADDSVVTSDNIINVDAKEFVCSYQGVFEDCDNLESVTIPSGVKLNNRSFAGCDKLSSVTIEEGNQLLAEGSYVTDYTSVGAGGDVSESYGTSYSFDRCSMLSEITIPSSWTKIPAGMFANTGLTNITNLGQITEIGYSAFDGAIHSKDFTVTLPNVIVVEENAFANCEMNTVQLPNITELPAKLFFATDMNSYSFPDVTSIGDSCFENSKTLSTVDATNILTYGNKAFKNSQIVSVNNLEVTSETATFGNEVFMNCDSLTDISLNHKNMFTEGKVGTSLFENCDNLEVNTIYETATYMPVKFYKGCPKITSFQMPKTVLTIGKESFMNSGLSSLNIREEGMQLTKIESRAFYNTQLTEVEFCTNVSSYTIAMESQCFGGCQKLKSYKMFSYHDITMIETFAGSALTQATIGFRPPGYPANLPTMTISFMGDSSGVFKGCKDLVEATIVAEKVPKECFKDCSNLETIHFGTSDMKIEDYAFYGCGKLNAPDLSTITTVGKYAFKGNGQTWDEISTMAELGEYAFSDIEIESVNYTGTKFCNTSFSTAINKVPALKVVNNAIMTEDHPTEDFSFLQKYAIVSENGSSTLESLKSAYQNKTYLFTPEDYIVDIQVENILDTIANASSINDIKSGLKVTTTSAANTQSETTNYTLTDLHYDGIARTLTGNVAYDVKPIAYPSINESRYEGKPGVFQTIKKEFQCNVIALSGVDEIFVNGPNEMKIGETKLVSVTGTLSPLLSMYYLASSDREVISIDRQGKMYAMKEGTATITVIYKNNPSVRNTLQVHVCAADSSIQFQSAPEPKTENYTTINLTSSEEKSTAGEYILSAPSLSFQLDQDISVDNTTVIVKSCEEYPSYFDGIKVTNNRILLTHNGADVNTKYAKSYEIKGWDTKNKTVFTNTFTICSGVYGDSRIQWILPVNEDDGIMYVIPGEVIDNKEFITVTHTVIPFAYENDMLPGSFLISEDETKPMGTMAVLNEGIVTMSDSAVASKNGFRLIVKGTECLTDEVVSPTWNTITKSDDLIDQEYYTLQNGILTFKSNITKDKMVEILAETKAMVDHVVFTTSVDMAYTMNREGVLTYTSNDSTVNPEHYEVPEELTRFINKIELPVGDYFDYSVTNDTLTIQNTNQSIQTNVEDFILKHINQVQINVGERLPYSLSNGVLHGSYCDVAFAPYITSAPDSSIIYIENGILYVTNDSYNKDTMRELSKLVSKVVLSEGVTTVKSNSFAPSVSEIILPSTIEVLQDSCFYDLSATIDASKVTKVSKIPNKAFLDFKGTIDLSKCKEITQIGSEAFSEMQSNNVTLPNFSKVTSLGVSAFYNMNTPNTDIDFSGNNTLLQLCSAFLRDSVAKNVNLSNTKIESLYLVNTEANTVTMPDIEALGSINELQLINGADLLYDGQLSSCHIQKLILSDKTILLGRKAITNGSYQEIVGNGVKMIESGSLVTTQITNLTLPNVEIMDTEFDFSVDYPKNSTIEMPVNFKVMLLNSGAGNTNYTSQIPYLVANQDTEAICGAGYQITTFEELNALKEGELVDFYLKKKLTTLNINTGVQRLSVICTEDSPYLEAYRSGNYINQVLFYDPSEYITEVSATLDPDKLEFTSVNDYSYQNIMESIKVQATYYDGHTRELEENEFSLESFVFRPERDMVTASVKVNNIPEMYPVHTSGDPAFVMDYSGYKNTEYITDCSLSFMNTAEFRTYVSGVTLNEHEINCEHGIGESGTLIATVSPMNAECKECIFSSSNDAVVTVTNDGQYTVCGLGEATITVTTVDGGYIDTCDFEVTGRVNILEIQGPNTIYTGKEATYTVEINVDLGMNDDYILELMDTTTESSLDNNTLSVGANETKETLTLKATSVADPTRFTTKVITILPTIDSVEISPESPIKKGNKETLTATVKGNARASKEVTWSIKSTHHANTTISSSGILSVSLEEEATSVIIKATSVYDVTKSDTIEIPLVEVVTGIILDGPNSIPVGKEGVFLATVEGSPLINKDVVWDIESEKSRIDENGIVTVSKEENMDKISVIVISKEDPTKRAEKDVSIIYPEVSPSPVAVSPSPKTSRIDGVCIDGPTNVIIGAKEDYEATVTGEGDYSKDVTWEVTENKSKDTQIDKNGRLTTSVSETSRSILITATSIQDPSKHSSLRVNLDTPTKYTKFKVRFYDKSKKLLKTKQVYYGGKVNPPKAPNVKRFSFYRWSEDTSHVVCDMDVYAQYKKDAFMFTTSKKIAVNSNFRVNMQGLVKGVKGKWTIQNRKIAKVSKTGVITGIKPGKTVVEYLGIKNGLCYRFRLNITIFSWKGKTLNTKLDSEPKYTIPVLYMDKDIYLDSKVKMGVSRLLLGSKVTYRSSNPSRITVTKKGTIQGKKFGKAVVIAKIVQNGNTYFYKLRCVCKARPKITTR